MIGKALIYINKLIMVYTIEYKSIISKKFVVFFQFVSLTYYIVFLTDHVV